MKMRTRDDIVNDINAQKENVKSAEYDAHNRVWGKLGDKTAFERFEYLQSQESKLRDFEKELEEYDRDPAAYINNQKKEH